MACVPATIGFFILRRGVRLRARGTQTSGLIVGSEKRLSNSSWCYYPKVEFQTSEGRTCVFTDAVGGGRMPRPGRRVKVIYYPNNPGDAEISSAGGISFFAIISLLFAVGFFGMSLIFYSGLIGPGDPDLPTAEPSQTSNGPSALAEGS
jgi:hypothetical protein